MEALIHTPHLFAQLNKLTHRDSRSPNTPYNRPHPLILHSATHHLLQIPHSRPSSIRILAALSNQHALILKVKRHVDGLDVRGRLGRARQVVCKVAELEEAVLQDFFVLVEFCEVGACGVFEGVPGGVGEAGPGFG